MQLMTQLDKLCNWYDSQNIRYHRIVTGFHTGIARVGAYDRVGYVNVQGTLYEVKDISQLGDFVEFDRHGDMVSFSKSYERDCTESGIYLTDEQLGITTVKVRLLKNGDYVRFDGVGIVVETTNEYRNIGGTPCFYNQYVSIQHKSGHDGNPSNSIKECIDWTSAYLITKEEYDNDE